jgi:D-arabinose 1-dehydrogenase-like Zn-dependent alcohol dehydrogenase
MKSEWLEEAKTTLSEDDISIDSVFEFEKAKDAFERLNTGRARGKVVIKVAQS